MPLPRILRRLAWLWGVTGLCAIGLLGVALFLPDVPAAEMTVTLVDPQGRTSTIPVDVADTDDERRRGLQGKTSVDRAMLFVFEDEAPRAFWMKDTLVPLDIVFFRADGTFAGAHSMPPCIADPCRSYPSQGPARYALEFGLEMGFSDVNADWSLRLN